MKQTSFGLNNAGSVIGCIILKHVEVSQELASFVVGRKTVGQRMNILYILGCEVKD